MAYERPKQIIRTCPKCTSSAIQARFAKGEAVQVMCKACGHTWYNEPDAPLARESAPKTGRQILHD